MNLDDFMNQMKVSDELVEIAQKQMKAFDGMINEAMFQFNGAEQHVVIAFKSKIDRVMEKAKKGDITYLQDLEAIKLEFKKYTDGRNSNG